MVVHRWSLYIAGSCQRARHQSSGRQQHRRHAADVRGGGRAVAAGVRPPVLSQALWSRRHPGPSTMLGLEQGDWQGPPHCRSNRRRVLELSTLSSIPSSVIESTVLAIQLCVSFVFWSLKNSFSAVNVRYIMESFSPCIIFNIKNINTSFYYGVFSVEQ